MLTPITLDCVDPDPHPVNNSHVCFKVEWDGEDVTAGDIDYCKQYNGDYNVNKDGYCCLKSTTKDFYFGEETEHNLKYYCVDALGNKGPIDDEKFKVEGTTFEIQLNKKWNLISVPFVLLNDSPEEVFESVEENVDSVWTYDAAADEWYVYHPGSPATSNLEEIVPGWGYWLAALEEDTLLLGGSLFSPATTPPSKDIKSGWNLIGHYGMDVKPAYCSLYSLGVDVWDKVFTSLFTYWEPNNPNQWEMLNEGDDMFPGTGYWMSVPQDGIYNYTTTCGMMGP